MIQPLSPLAFTTRLFFCALMWSSGFLFMKSMAGTIDPMAMASVRGVIAATVLSGWFLVRRLSPLPTRNELVPWLVLGTFNGWLPNILTAFALIHIAVSLGSMIQASGPLLVAVMSHFAFAEETLTPRKIGGILVGFFGMAVLIGPAALMEAEGAAIGVAAMVFVSVSYALGNVYARQVRHVEPSRMALGQQAVSGLVATLLTLAFSGTAAYLPTLEHAPEMIALGIIATALPITLYMGLIRSNGPTKAAMIGYLLPVFATGLAVLLLGEHVGLRDLLGGAIILAGVYTVSTAPSKIRG